MGKLVIIRVLCWELESSKRQGEKGMGRQEEEEGAWKWQVGRSAVGCVGEWHPGGVGAREGCV